MISFHSSRSHLVIELGSFQKSVFSKLFPYLRFMFPYPKNTAFSTYTFGRLAKPQTYDLASYTFGSIKASVSKGEYKYGMNTQEKDNEIYGEGNSYSAEYWQYDARLARRWNMDPETISREWISPFNVMQNNPILRVDINGALDWEYDQQIDGSWKKREGNKNDGGENNHMYVFRNGDISFYNKQTGKMSTIKAGSVQKKIEDYKVKKTKINSTIEKTGSVVNNVGDGVAAVGYAAAPFTEGASLVVAGVGEIISLVGAVIEHSAKVSKDGFTQDNVTDITIDAAFELAPVPLEMVIKKTNLDAPSKKILKAQVNKVNLATEFGVKQNNIKKEEK